MGKPTIWVIEDDVALRLILDDTLHDAGFAVKTFGQAKLAWQQLEQLADSTADLLTAKQPNPLAKASAETSAEALPHAIITDIRMPMMDGLTFSEKIHSHFPHIPVIIMTAHADVQSAVDSYQAGAFDYLPKPFELDEAVNMVTKAVTQYAINQQVLTQSPRTGAEVQPPTAHFVEANTAQIEYHQAQQAVQENPHGIIGQSVSMQQVFRAIGRLANTHITVLINGESGTGKELIAHALHEHSPRKHKPFIALNMAAIPHDLIESELFGHEKGAFTGATTTRQGRFEQAHGGTLFLDEIGDMPLPTQTRLLRVLANGEFFRVGGQKPIKVDVRIIAATHQPLETLVKQGKFREDLFYRLNVIRLTLPALRERRDDIPLLVNFFMHSIAQSMNIPTKTIAPSTLQVLQEFDWQGNVRQLENTCRWLTVMASGQQVQIGDLPPEILTFYHSKIETQSPPTPHTPLPIIDATPFIDANKANQANKTNSDQAISVTQSYVTPLAPTSQRLPKDTDWLTPLSHWATQQLTQGNTQALQNAVVEFERCLLQTTLQYTGNHKGKTAELLGWGRNTVTRKFQQLL